MAVDFLGRVREGLVARPWALLVLITFVALGTGFALGSGSRERASGDSPSSQEQRAYAEGKHAELYTCSMHPNIIRDRPGDCPICGMSLVAVETGPAGQGDGIPGDGLRLSPYAAALAQVETSLVERRRVVADVRLVGTIAFDQTRIRTVSAWLPGRIDRLFVDYLGVSVEAGDHLGMIYGPDLMASQQDLIESARSLSRAAKGTPALVPAAQARLAATRDRFRLWGFTPDQIRRIERQKQPEDHMTIYSPSSGVVIERAVDEGSYVREGDTILRIADLSELWLVMAAYESDLPWLRYGQEIDFQVRAIPGEHFSGTIVFISPVVDPATRTTLIRANLDNADGRFKPDMFARARVKVQLGKGGEVVAPVLEGKWIGAMHPEIVRDEPGLCPICGMQLVAADTAGAQNSGLPLVIPATAPLITGDRAVVYVAHIGDDASIGYEGREVKLGPRAENAYVVLEGLVEGERVVTRGAFKVDSSIQIQAKRSMMSPQGSAGPHSGHFHSEN